MVRLLVYLSSRALHMSTCYVIMMISIILCLMSLVDFHQSIIIRRVLIDTGEGKPEYTAALAAALQGADA